MTDFGEDKKMIKQFHFLLYHFPMLYSKDLPKFWLHKAERKQSTRVCEVKTTVINTYWIAFKFRKKSETH